ncbi:FtsK/SpoIIIE domain-containing protein [Tersicoccus sp. Bi-70]|uniref:FtsK/SpoIIIE domain-containing protein n=1 Tax=Tersicoccus sp. Bi-70 TaxID=1897634 RepID=UPI00117D4723|nr:FtsK/SpoIIIE domain-containing protein [Tersicoccus sp. Bi-70]
MTEPTGPGPILAALVLRVCGRGDATVDGVALDRVRVLPATNSLVVRVGVPPRRSGGEDGVGTVPPTDRDLAAGLVLGVAGGAGAGTLLALHRGRHTIGRAGSDLVIDDPSVSRHHATLDVLPDRIVLSDTGSANGLVVDGRRQVHAVVTVDSRITVGSVPLRLRAADDLLPSHPTRLGAPLEKPASFVPPAVVSRSAPPGLLAVSAALPLVIGMVLAVTTGSWMLLGLTAMSVPVSLVPALTAVRAARMERRRGGHPASPRGASNAGGSTVGTGAGGGNATAEDADGVVGLPDLTVHQLAAHQHAGPGVPDERVRGGRAPVEHDLVERGGAGGLGGGAPGNHAPAVPARPAAPLRLGSDQAFVRAGREATPGRRPRWRVRRRPPRGGRRTRAVGLRSAAQRPPSPVAAAATVVIDLAAQRRIDLLGPAHATAGLVRAVLTQLAGLDPALRVHLCVDAQTSASARLLPCVTVLSPALADLGGGQGDGTAAADVLIVELSRLDARGRAELDRVLQHPPPVLILIGAGVADPATASGGVAADRAIVRLAIGAHCHAGPSAATGPGATRTCATDTASSNASARNAGSSIVTPTRTSTTVLDAGSAATGSIVTADGERSFVPDLMTAAAFEDHCVWRAASAQPAARIRSSSALPAHCAAEAVHESARSRTGTARLPCVLGMGTDGPLMIDLATDGPHLLIAGTTGAGKSELLRTLVTSLVRDRTPAQLGLVLIDFKGGTALAPLAALPHCDALITDLDGGLDRALASVRAELRQREALLRRWGADGVDDAAIPPDAAPGRLVIVIDEFRVMVDDHPDGLAELVRLAAQGRSLGIHLVMATQRPRGAVNGDIRANTAIRIALRTQSEEESFDVLGSPVAARLPARLPGRAWISVGDRPPVLFQTATVTLADGIAGALRSRPAMPRIARWDAEGIGENAWLVLPAPSTAGDPAPPPAAPASPARRCIIAPPLPPACSGSDVLLHAAEAARPGSAPLGLIDRPDEQRLQPWLHRPGVDAHLAVLGEDRPAVVDVVRRLLAATAAGARCYLLDAADTLAGVLPETAIGARVTAAEPQRAARVLERLVQTVDARGLAATDARAESATGARPGDGPDDEPTTLLLVVHDWSVWSAAFRAHPGAGGEELLVRLASGSAPSLKLIVSGGRDLLASRMLTALGCRVHVPGTADPLTVAGWPRLPRVERIPGRVVVEAPDAGPVPARAQLILPPMPQTITPPVDRGDPVGDGPVIRALPTRLTLAQMLPHRTGGVTEGSAGWSLLAGLGGDGKDPRHLVVGPGRVLPVIGAPGSGRSTLLRALLALDADRRGTYRDRPDPDITGPHHVEEPTVTLWPGARPDPGGTGPGVLLVDDADTADPASLQRLGDLVAEGFAVVVVVATSTALTHRLPLISAALVERRFVVVGMDDPTALTPLGVRLPVDPTAVRGRAMEVNGSGRHLFQVPDVTGDPFSRRPGREW